MRPAEVPDELKPEYHATFEKLLRSVLDTDNKLAAYAFYSKDDAFRRIIAVVSYFNLLIVLVRFLILHMLGRDYSTTEVTPCEQSAEICLGYEQDAYDDEPAARYGGHFNYIAS